jgi:diguanylate cyclase (GGDEF)-like protein
VDSLTDLFRELGNSLQLEEILSTLDQGLQRLIVYDSLAVLLVEDSGLTTVYDTGRGRLSLPWFQISPGEEIVAGAARERRPVLHHLDSELGRTESVLIFPIEFAMEQAREIIAVLLLHGEGENGFSSEAVQLLRELAPKLAASVGNARKYHRVQQLAEADPLTGLANARSLFRRLDAEVSRARRSRNTLAVLQCSVDGFDRSGCLCSEAATRCAFEKVALKLRENCREYDFAARSGDELVLVLPGFRREFLEEKCAFIRKAVEETGLSAGLPLFAAVGAAMFPEDGIDAEDLLTAAAESVVLARQLASLAPGAH